MIKFKKHLVFRTTIEQFKSMKRIAEHEGVSVSELIRLAINDFIDNWEIEKTS